MVKAPSNKNIDRAKADFPKKGVRAGDGIPAKIRGAVGKSLFRSGTKYTRVIQNIIGELMMNPTDDFVRLISNEYTGGKRFTPAIKEQFAQITKKAFQQLVNDRINERLKVAMSPAAESNTENATAPVPIAVEPDESQIVTTEQEIEGFHIVRSILRDVISPRRIVMRDAQSYCAILFDDNNRKPICRLWFNNPSRLMLGLINGKEQEKMPLSDVDDIYNYAEQLKATIATYINSES